MSFPTELKTLFIKILNDNKITYTHGWSNYMETVKNPAALVIEVNNEEQLQIAIKAIEKMNAKRDIDNKITIRATAGWTDKAENSCCLFPWKSVQENTYNEGFSFSQVVGGRATPLAEGTDVIVRFSKKFHNIHIIGPLQNATYHNPNNPIHCLPAFAVEVSAGVQIAELSDFLRKKELSLPTASMIAWVTAVGLAGTAGHGTGRDEPAFSGLIESMKICDMDGTIRELTRQHPDFETLVGGHSGLLGVVLSVTLRTVSAFNLCETVELFHNTKEMKDNLPAILENNQYVSIMGMPSFTHSAVDKVVPKWQILKWNYTQSKPTKNEKPSYAPSMASFTQELEIGVGAPLLDFIIDSGLNHLLPAYMLFAAAMTTGSRGTKPRIDFENNITHPQVSFPKLMRDVSYIIPVKDNVAGSTLEFILGQIEDLLEKASIKGEYPITYAIYVRYYKGTNGGLSTSCTSSEDERVFAIDMVTHPEAPGIAKFERQFVSILNERGITARNHLGKQFPVGITRYDQFLDSQAILQFKEALARWHDTHDLDNGNERFAKSPFNTHYLQDMLSTTPTNQLHNLMDKQGHHHDAIMPSLRRPKHYSEKECNAFLHSLHAKIQLIPDDNKEIKAAKDEFLVACEQGISAQNDKIVHFI